MVLSVHSNFLVREWLTQNLFCYLFQHPPVQHSSDLGGWILVVGVTASKEGLHHSTSIDDYDVPLLDESGGPTGCDRSSRDLAMVFVTWGTNLSFVVGCAAIQGHLSQILLLKCPHHSTVSSGHWIPSSVCRQRCAPVHFLL